jgi:RimJ/RimL family protein N-acetyltransferase
MIELGYEIAEPYRLKGLATETAQGLIDFACQDNRVKIVRAHTLATLNPSVSVLEKLNFYLVGLFNDPDDGDIWRWEFKV